MKSRPGTIIHVALCVAALGGSASAAQHAPTAVTPPTRREVAAALITTPLRIDGALDDEAWQLATATSDFVQAEPYEGEPATERTDVRILYDSDNLYIGVVCRDSAPNGVRVNALKEDFEPGDADYFQIILDTYRDQRGGFLFATNPQGAKRDAQVSDEGRTVNADWDAVWDVRAFTTTEGWTAEFVIPFKSLNFDASRPEQVWGLNMSRKVRRKNEIDFWSPVPRRYDISQLSLAGELKGLRAVERGHNLRVKPFAIGDVTRLSTRDRTQLSPDAGVDVKYSVTPTLTMDLTANTDFSQVEVDEQVVNLTRFAVVFPEKREFFLENSGIFQFGDVPFERGPDRQKEIQLFFSRRIGLFPDEHPRQGEPIGIWGGTRLSGRIGRYSVGALSMQTKAVEDDPRTAAEDSLPSNNYSAVRVKRDILSNSDVGAIVLNRQASGRADYNRAYGVDGNFRFYQNLTINAYLAETKSDGLSCESSACRGKKIGASWRSNLLRLQAIYTNVGERFNPEVGLKGMPAGHGAGQTLRATMEVHLRPPRNPIVREIHPHPRFFSIVDPGGRTVYKEGHFSAAEVLFHNGSRAEVSWNPRFERLDRPFTIPGSPGVLVPAGDYRYGYWQFEAETDQSRSLFATADIQKGSYYTGESNMVNVSATLRPGYHWSAQAALVNSQVTVEGTQYTTRVIRTRVTYSISTRMFVNALVQYNSSRRQVTANMRFDFIHRPLSDLFIVLNEARDVSGLGRDDRVFTVKYTHLLSF